MRVSRGLARRLDGDRVVGDREQQSGGDRDEADRPEDQQRAEAEEVGDPARVVDARADALGALAVVVVVDDLGAVAAADGVRGDLAAAEPAEDQAAVSDARRSGREVLGAPGGSEWRGLCETDEPQVAQAARPSSSCGDGTSGQPHVRLVASANAARSTPNSQQLAFRAA